MRTQLMFLLAAGLSFVLAVPASAAVVSIGANQDSLTVTAAPGETNTMTIASAGLTYTVRDTGVAPTAGDANCSAAGDTVTCTALSVPSVSVNLADMNDSVDAGGATVSYGSLVGGPGDDTITAGTATNYLYLYGDGAGLPAVTDGKDTLTAGPSGSFYLYGSGNDDKLVAGAVDYVRLDGGPGNDLLTGGPGQNYFYPGLGADTMTGGGGSDYVYYSERAEPLTLSLDDVANDGAAGEHDNLGSDIPNIYGGAGNDTITGSANGNYLYGNAGNDVIDGGGGDDGVYGGAGNDTLAGGDGFDYLYGEGGNDALSGGGENDYLYGGGGADDLHGGDGTNDYAYYLYDHPTGIDVSIDDVANDGSTGEGDNVHSDVEAIAGSPAADTITGSMAAEYLYGNGGNDTLNGAGGDDWIYGGSGVDQLSGGDGDDTLDGGPGADVNHGGEGEDTGVWWRATGATVWLDGSPRTGEANENDQVFSDVEDVETGAGRDVIHGSAADNRIDAGAGNDKIYGRGGRDELFGGKGRDTIDAGPGQDAVDAGSGNDTILAKDRTADEIRCGGGFDTVKRDRGRDHAQNDCEKLK